MKKIEIEYRLPLGGYTTDGNKFAKAWNDLAKPICEATGARPHAFDPSKLQ